MLDNYICALDIGSSKLAAMVAEAKRRRLSRIYFESLPAKGVQRGGVVDSIDLIGSIGKALKNLRAKSGINIKYVYVNISGQDITTKHSHAIIPLAERGNKVITLSDIRKVNEQARILGSNLEEEAIQHIPFGYSIDSRSGIANPLGLYSHRLESDLYLICAKLSSVQSLNRAISQAGFELKKLFFSGVATGKAVFSPQLQEEGSQILCDIGSDITELLVFKGGILKDIEILGLGGDDLTKELMAQLKISYDLAEDVKRSFGAVGDLSRIAEEKEILVKKENAYRPIKQKLVAEIINAKTKSICQTIKDTVEKKADLGTIGTFMVAGRTILLEGFLETLENTLGVAVKLGRIRNPELVSLTSNHDALSGQKYLTYLTCLGLLCLANEKEETLALPVNMPRQNYLSKALNRLKEVYQEYF